MTRDILIYKSVRGNHYIIANNNASQNRRIYSYINTITQTRSTRFLALTKPYCCTFHNINVFPKN